MATPKRKTARKSNLTLFEPEHDSKERHIYLYRDAGNGEPAGNYLEKTHTKLKETEIRRKYGPGRFYLMEAGGNLPLRTEPIFVKPDPHGEPEKQKPPAPDDFWKQRERILQYKILEREARGDPTPIELITALVPILQGRTTGPQNALLDAYIQGTENAPDVPPADPLTTALTSLIPAQSKSDPQLRRVIAGLYEQQKQLAGAIADLRSEIITIKNNPEIPVRVDPSPASSGGDLDVLVSTLELLAAAGVADLTPQLMELGSAAPGLLNQILDSDPADLDQIARPILVQYNREHLLADWLSCIQKFRTARGSVAVERFKQAPEGDPPPDS